MPRIDVVIVNWHSGPLVDACLGSLARTTQHACALGRVYVFDNSPEAAYRPVIPDRLDVELIRSPANVGFSRGCNLAAGRSDADLLLFLNPDTEVMPDTLDACARFMGSSAATRCGALGVQLLDRDGVLQKTCSRFPTPAQLLGQSLGLGALSSGRIAGPFMTDWDHRETRVVDQVMGAFMLMPRPVFERLGGFDEDFFLYFEDVDLCLRLARAGHETIYFAGARAMHIGQGTTRRNIGRRFYLYARSRFQYARKHFGMPAAALLLLTTLSVEPVLRIARELLQGAPAQAAAVARGWMLLWRASLGLPAREDRVGPGPAA